MTPKEQRIAIAEIDGFIVAPYKTFSEVPIGGTIKGRLWWTLPNYLHDLNAILDVVRKQKGKYFDGCYLDALIEIRTGKRQNGLTMNLGVRGFFSVVTATAADHAKALLIVKGKWSEPPLKGKGEAG